MALRTGVLLSLAGLAAAGLVQLRWMTGPEPQHASTATFTVKARKDAEVIGEGSVVPAEPGVFVTASVPMKRGFWPKDVTTIDVSTDDTSVDDWYFRFVEIGLAETWHRWLPTDTTMDGFGTVEPGFLNAQFSSPRPTSGGALMVRVKTEDTNDAGSIEKFNMTVLYSGTVGAVAQFNPVGTNNIIHPSKWLEQPDAWEGRWELQRITAVEIKSDPAACDQCDTWRVEYVETRYPDSSDWVRWIVTNTKDRHDRVIGGIYKSVRFFPPATEPPETLAPPTPLPTTEVPPTEVPPTPAPEAPPTPGPPAPIPAPPDATPAPPGGALPEPLPETLVPPDTQPGTPAPAPEPASAAPVVPDVAPAVPPQPPGPVPSTPAPEAPLVAPLATPPPEVVPPATPPPPVPPRHSAVPTPRAPGVPATRAPPLPSPAGAPSADGPLSSTTKVVLIVLAFLLLLAGCCLVGLCLYRFRRTPRAADPIEEDAGNKDAEGESPATAGDDRTGPSATPPNGGEGEGNAVELEEVPSFVSRGRRRSIVGSNVSSGVASRSPPPLRVVGGVLITEDPTTGQHKMHSVGSEVSDHNILQSLVRADSGIAPTRVRTPDLCAVDTPRLVTYPRRSSSGRMRRSYSGRSVKVHKIGGGVVNAEGELTTFV